MACFHPVEVAILRKSLGPKRLRVRDAQTVPCGHCHGCRQDQARDWTIRLMHENRLHESSCFMTLTYDEEHLPTYGTLRPGHLRAFLKALRKRQKGETLRYFACGEYGDKTQRPHYHAVLFNPHILDGYNPDPVLRPTVWRSETLDATWKYRGIAEWDNVTTASAAYVAGYVRKKVSKKYDHTGLVNAYTRIDPTTGELVQLEQEFTRMSLRPAIGMEWIQRWWRDVYPRDFVTLNGMEFQPPRYYDKWMDGDAGLNHNQCDDCREHQQIMMETREKRMEEAKELTAYELAAREKDHEARHALFNKRDTI